VRRADAVALLAVMAGGTALALLAPWPVALALAVGSVALMRGRRAFLPVALVTLAINTAILAWAEPGGWRLGLEGGLRLVAGLGVSLAVMSRVGAARLLEGLRLGPRATAWSAAVLLAAEDARTDFARLRLARELEGAWPEGRFARAREAASLLPPLLVSAYRRATIRREALRLAGHDTPPRFVPIVAVAALATAGRLAFLALPNVALTYAVVFLGGVLFGPLVGAAGAALAMLVTDLMLTGLYPPGLVNVPAMMLLGLAGGALRRVDYRGASGAMLAGALGIASMFLFSVASDVATWAILYAPRTEALAPIVVLGLAFNVVPALVNGALFAASVGPCVSAFDAWRPREAPAGGEEGQLPALPSAGPLPPQA